MGRLISNLSEIYVSSDNAAKALTFANVGLTDSATAQIEPHPLIITDDFELSNRLASMGRDVLNINHIRPMAWLWNQ
jgi:hypothetical protein